MALLKPLPGILGALPPATAQSLSEALQRRAFDLGLTAPALMPAQERLDAFLTGDAHPLDDPGAGPPDGLGDLLKSVFTTQAEAQSVETFHLAAAAAASKSLADFLSQFWSA